MRKKALLFFLFTPIVTLASPYEFEIIRTSHIGSVRYDKIKYDQKFFINGTALSDKLFSKYKKQIEDSVIFLKKDLFKTDCVSGELTIKDVSLNKNKKTCTEGEDYVNLVVMLEEIKGEM